MLLNKPLIKTRKLCFPAISPRFYPKSRENVTVLSTISRKFGCGCSDKYVCGWCIPFHMAERISPAPASLPGQQPHRISTTLGGYFQMAGVFCLGRTRPLWDFFGWNSADEPTNRSAQTPGSGIVCCDLCDLFQSVSSLGLAENYAWTCQCA